MASNKEIATTFLKMAASGDILRAYEQFVSPKFIHHNQYFPGDRASLMNGMLQSDKTHPNKLFVIKQVFENKKKGTVAMFSHVKQKKMDIAVVHIVRISRGKIVEMWDVGQLLSKKSPNKNGMF